MTGRTDCPSCGRRVKRHCGSPTCDMVLCLDCGGYVTTTGKVRPYSPTKPA